MLLICRAQAKNQCLYAKW